ncbi:MAG: hypothetical protein AB1742_09570 [bacterium]
MNVIIGGLIALALGIWGLVAWWWLVVETFQAVLPVILILGGLIAIAAGLRGMERQAKLTTQKPERERAQQKRSA